MDLLRLEEALIGYQQPLLGAINLSVSSHDRLAVLGPNGGGKSTLLKSLIGLVPLLGGRRVIAASQLRVGYVPQAHRADPVYPLTALEVTLQGRYGLIGLARRPRAIDVDSARETLSRVGMLEKSQQQFRSLSGGQRQRVLLARALCGEPQLLVLDEFTSDLDPAAAADLLAEVSQLARDRDVAVVFVTHEISAAASHSDQVALVDVRARLFQTGRTADLLTGDRMTALYGQAVSIERQGDRTVVHVEAARSGARPT